MINRKGQEHGLWWFFYLGVMIIFVISVAFLINRVIDVSLETQDLEKHVLFSRFMLSPNSIFYTDPLIQRTYPGIIDMNKFNMETLEKLYDEESRTRIGFEIKLEGEEDLHYDENLFDIAFPIITIEGAPYELIEAEGLFLVRQEDGRLSNKKMIIKAVYPTE